MHRLIFSFKSILFYSLITSLVSCNFTPGTQSNVDPNTGVKEVNLLEDPEVSIVGDKFFINGTPTFEGRSWNGYEIEGLLPNSRMVNGIFDDENAQTKERWGYPDSDEWNPDRNTAEFVAAMESWYQKGMLSFTVNLQGGSPMGYGNQGWINTAFDADGNLKIAYMNRLELILDEAKKLGMIPIVGLFYFGQDEYLKDEQAVKNAVTNTINWLHDKQYKNILIEINNECNGAYDHEILFQYRVHELIELAKSIEKNGHRYLVSTSYTGKHLPKSNVVKVADYILLHGNGMDDPNEIIQLVNETKKVEGYIDQPIVYNEDDNYGFDKNWNNFIAATSVHTSWGFFDYRRNGESFENGFQSIPANWEISSRRKQDFFSLVEEITGGIQISN